MKQLFISVAALAAISSAALAGDYGNSPSGLSERDMYHDGYVKRRIHPVADDAHMVFVPFSSEDREQRRLDEKDTGNGNGFSVSNSNGH